MITSTPEKVEEINSTKFDDKWITNERNRRKCKSNKEKMKIKSAGMLELNDEKVENNKNSGDRFNSFSNLNFSRIFSGLLEEKQRNCSKIFTSPSERIEDTSLCTDSVLTEPVLPEFKEGILDSQDRQLLDILEELQTVDPNVPSERLTTSGTN